MSRIETPSNPDPNASGTVSRMAGGPSASSLDTLGDRDDMGMTPADPSQMLSAGVAMCSKADQLMVTLSESFPQISPDIREARAAIGKVVQALVSNPGGGEPPAPRTML